MSIERPPLSPESVKPRAFGEKWLVLAQQNPKTYLKLARKSGEPLPLLIVRKPVPGADKIQYLVFKDTRRKYLERFFEQKLKEKDQIAWFYPSEIDATGKVQITNARIFSKHDRREGIGTAVYDLIEQDVRAAGGTGLEPMLGVMSDDAVEFWKERRTADAELIEAKGRQGS